MVLPEELFPYFNAIKDDYAQTCSKTEQLTLALFMEKGYYQTGLKKLRRLYAQKWTAVVDILSAYTNITTSGSPSGINMIIHITTDKKSGRLVQGSRFPGYLRYARFDQCIAPGCGAAYFVL